MPKKVWVRGVVGRLARIEPRGAFLPVTKWTPTVLTPAIQKKADQGDLELALKNPHPVAAAPKKAPAAPAKEAK